MISFAIKPKILIALLFLICISKTTTAQTKLASDVIASSGQHLENANVQLDYTLGEFMVQNLKGSSQVTQGFQQAQLSMMIPVIEPSFVGKIGVFPNPVSSTLTVAVRQEGNFVVTIHDFLGTVVIHRQFSGEAILDMEMLVQGSYGLVISADHVPVYSSIIEKAK